MSFAKTLQSIAQKLQGFYGLSLDADPADYVISTDILEALKGEPTAQHGSQVLVHIDDDEDGSPQCNLALYFPDHIKEQLDSCNPLASLSLANLNSVWVVIEELSHFLLLATRSLKDQQTTALELEWQAEIDKLLMTAALLSQQNGKSQALEVSALLHNHCRFTRADPVYREAQFFAQKFWYHQSVTLETSLDNSLNPSQNEQLVERLRTLYPLNWPQKLDKIV